MADPQRPAHASAEPLILDNVRKTFGNTHAVDGVSFELKPGELLTMLGPSGSGKTTTLNMIAGFLEPDAGSIVLGNRDITTLPPHKRGIGMVFQNYALFPHLTAVQNVAFPLEMRGVSRREARSRTQAALELVELQQQARKLPKQLSGGQQQRVALARAFVFEPGLLLMDEPLGALDKRLRETMQIEIMRVCRTVGATVVYVTHDQHEALVMSDRIAIYRDGHIEQFGTAQDLYERPASVFVADFIGESNILRGTIDGDGTAVGQGWHVPAAEGRFATGTDVSLILRPESCVLEAADATDDRPCSILGVIGEVVYLGSEFKYLVQSPAGHDIEARVPRGAAVGRYAAGDQVRLSWRAEDSLLLPNGAA